MKSINSKHLTEISLVLLSLFFTSVSAAQQGTDPYKKQTAVLKGPYMGQKTPGFTPQLFAPGYVNSKDWGDSGRFSLDMNQFHVYRWRLENRKKVTRAYMFEKQGEQWVRKATDNIGRKPFFAPDGQTIHYGKSYKTRTADGWSELKSLGADYQAIRIMRLTVSAKGTYVFDEIGTNGNGTLRYSTVIDGKRQPPKPLSKNINTGTWNAHPFIAPDESYILWDGERDGGYGDNDLYVSFKQADGSWGKAINLGDKINTAAQEGGPQITPDGKYLFFNRSSLTAEGKVHSDLYWVDAKVVEQLKP